mgnify:CR=1 FL=1
MNSNLHELLRYFLETASLQVKPENTRLYRMLLLRVLYSIGNIDVQACVDMLLENGIMIGDYNKTTTLASLFQGLTTMRVLEWVELMRSLEVTRMDALFGTIQSVYADDIASSPLWSLKNAFEVIYHPCLCPCLSYKTLILVCVYRKMGFIFLTSPTLSYIYS